MLRNPFTPPCGFDLASTTVESPHDLDAITYWGYRLVVHPEGTCFLHETYYDEREGILGIAREPARPCGDGPSDIEEALNQMGQGLLEPSLRYSQFASNEAPPGASGDGAGTVPDAL